MVRLDGLCEDCCGFCQEVERVGSDLNCAGSLCLFSYCGEITRLRKDCGELRQEVERLRTGGGQEVLQLQRVSVSHPYK